MDAEEFMRVYGRDEAIRVAERAGTNIAYFYQIATKRRFPSRRLALRLVQASAGRLSYADLLAPAEWARA